MPQLQRALVSETSGAAGALLDLSDGALETEHACERVMRRVGVRSVSDDDEVSV